MKAFTTEFLKEFVTPSSVTDPNVVFPSYKNMPLEIKNSKILSIRTITKLNIKCTENNDSKFGYVIFAKEENKKEALALLTKYDWPTLFNIDPREHEKTITWTAFIPSDRIDLQIINSSLYNGVISSSRFDNMYFGRRYEDRYRLMLRKRDNKFNHFSYVNSLTHNLKPLDDINTNVNFLLIGYINVFNKLKTFKETKNKHALSKCFRNYLRYCCDYDDHCDNDIVITYDELYGILDKIKLMKKLNILTGED